MPAMSQAVMAEQSMARSPPDLKAASMSAWQGLIERNEQSAGIFTVGMNTHFPLSHIATRQSDIPNHATRLTSSSLRAEDCNRALNRQTYLKLNDQLPLIILS
jgi:hypothetical protein